MIIEILFINIFFRYFFLDIFKTYHNNFFIINDMKMSRNMLYFLVIFLKKIASTIYTNDYRKIYLVIFF